MASNLKLGAAIALTALGAGVAADARDHGGPGAALTFESLDIDGSGEITTSDLDARRDARFAELDLDGDGTVSEAEFVAFAQARAQERASRVFERLDADGDGRLSRDVIEREGRRGPDAARLVERFDTNGSGGVDASEFEAAKDRLAERRRDHGGKRRR